MVDEILRITKMRYLIFLLALAFPQVAGAQAANVYITQNGSGNMDGSSLANAGACDATPNSPQTTCAFFNNASNWGTGPKQIGPGTVIHLGDDGNPIMAAQSTSASYLQFQGSGSTSGLIELRLNAALVLSSPQFYIAIDGNNNSYLLIDSTAPCGPGTACSTNQSGTATIENTANGTALTYQNLSILVYVSNGSNIEVKNLLTLNNYIRTAGSSDESAGATGTENIFGAPGSNVYIHDITGTYAEHNIALGGTPHSASNWNIFNCKVWHQVWGINVATGNSSQTISGVNIYGNEVNNYTEWNEASGGTFHFDGIFVYGQGTSDGSGSVDNVSIYNNYLWGNWGVNAGSAAPSAYVYTNGNLHTVNLFNNVFNVTSGGSVADALYYYGNYISNVLVANNTFVGYSNSSYGGGLAVLDFNMGPISNVSIQNNVFFNLWWAVNVSYSGPNVFDYNFYGGECHTFMCGGPGTYQSTTASTNYFNLTQATANGYPNYNNWQSTGNDVHGGYSDTILNAGTFTLPVGSVGLQSANNLSSICAGQPNPGLGALCFDKSGTARPKAPTAWDAGAFQHGAAVINSPGGLVATGN